VNLVSLKERLDQHAPTGNRLEFVRFDDGLNGTTNNCIVLENPTHVRGKGDTDDVDRCSASQEDES
jgi:hypothetical protein